METINCDNCVNTHILVNACYFATLASICQAALNGYYGALVISMGGFLASAIWLSDVMFEIVPYVWKLSKDENFTDFVTDITPPL